MRWIVSLIIGVLNVLDIVQSQAGNWSSILPTTSYHNRINVTTKDSSVVEIESGQNDRLPMTTPFHITKQTSNWSSIAPEFEIDFCRYAPIPEKQYIEDCCAIHYERYVDRFISGSYYLTTILERMKRWGCKQFDQECVRPSWSFTEYTRHMYDLFCNRTVLESRCYEKVSSLVISYQFSKSDSIPKSWKKLIEMLRSDRMEISDLTEPCVQVALFDREDGGVGRFHEIVEHDMPFCGIQVNGYDYNTAMTRSVSPWTGIPTWCKASIIICIIVIAIAGTVTIFLNVLILVVFGKTENLRNSQAIYKMSVALADLLVGLIVWPNMIALQYMTFFNPRTMGSVVLQPYVNNTSREPFNNKNITYRYGGGSIHDRFSNEYLLTMGFLSVLGIMASVYTLMIASFDRFSAVFRPLKYSRVRAKKQAKLCCLILWKISILVCLIPVFTPSFKYEVLTSNMILMEGEGALVFVTVTLLFPLAITWVVTVLTFFVTRQHAKARQKLVSSTAASSDELERRLAKTLSIMVGVFTLCLLPTLFCAVAGFLSTTTDWNSPRQVNITSTTAYTTSEYLAVIILTSNSLWNFFIYSLRTRGFKEAASSLLQKLKEKSGLGTVSRSAMRVIHGAGRVNLSTILNMRRFSEPDSSDSRKKSISSLHTGTSKISETNSTSGTRPSVDLDTSSVFAQSTTAYNTTYEKNVTKVTNKKSTVNFKADRKKAKKIEEDEYAGEDSTFGSFVIDARTDRLFESVMENVDEEIESTDKA